jgi:hypothetical protein
VTSPPAAQNALGTCLEELERLGLVRPASVLLTEFLAALAAENVIEAGAASRIAAVYHRLHYGTVDRDDFAEQAAVESLKKAAATIGGLPQPERQSLAGRIASRLQPTPDKLASSPIPFESLVQPPVGTDWAGRRSNAAVGAIAPQSFDPSRGLAVESGFVSEPASKQGRRTLRIRSLPLETATLVVLGLIVCGYLLRNGIDQTIRPNQAETAASGQPHVIARDVWRHEDYWAHNLRWRAHHLAAHQQDQKARLAFELLLSDVPRDAESLNDLAWLYLTTNDPAMRNPKRGLELALRAIEIRREPAFLDTAAEARFQNGHPAEAVKLEQEALDTLPRFMGFEDKRFRNILKQQLEKFQKAATSASRSR